MRERDVRLMTMRTTMMKIVWETRKSIEMMTQWMILARSIVVIFSAKKILSMNLICWIADRWIERFEVQLRMNVVCSMIQKLKMMIDVWLSLTMKIVVWWIEKSVVLLIEMIAVWLTAKMKIVVWLIIFLCSEIELFELIVLLVMILIFVIRIVIVLVTNNL